MSAGNVVMEARAAGTDLRVEGDDLLLEAGAPPLSAVRELLSHHKPEIVARLRPGRDGWSAEDWQAYFDERAGTAEFDGGLPRPEAETRAFECCVVEWLNRNFERSPPGRCLACGGGDHAHDALLPHGIEPTGHVWLHSRCWPDWHSGRKAQAVSALKANGDRAAGPVSRRFREKRRRMMGGFGSGRPSGSGRDTVEACRSIDVNRLHHEGCLHAGWAGGWQWTRDGEKVASINLRAEPDRLHLSYLDYAGAEPSAPSASSAPSAPLSKPSRTNDSAASSLRTVACDADGGSGGPVPTVRASSLKSDGGTDADGADANRPAQSGPKETAASGWRARL